MDVKKLPEVVFKQPVWYKRHLSEYERLLVKQDRDKPKRKSIAR
jgi:putative transposase